MAALARLNHRRRLAAVGLIALMLPPALAACRHASASFRGSKFDPARPAPDFTLTDQHGRPFRLAKQRGRIVLLFFGYTRCPDVCPTTLAVWRRTQAALGRDGGRVRFVLITVDPEWDTSARLGRYLAACSPEFIGLSGTPDALAAVYRAYGVVREKVAHPGSEPGYLVTHPLHGLRVPAGGRVELRPGGVHVMLMGLRRALQTGDRFPISLRFERAGIITVSVEVR